jgi:ATP-binding protein involved in chromosome partitioning
VVSKDAVIQALKRIKGPDLEGNIVDLGLVSEVLIRDGKVYFSITVPAARAEELEPLRQAAEKVVKDLPGIVGVTAVLTAESRGGSGARNSGPAESSRVAAARGRGTLGDGAGHGHNHSHSPAPAGPAGGGSRRGQPVEGVRHLVAVASGKGGVGKSTTAINLALGFQAIGLKAGVLDADIFGPSQPRLLGLSGKPQAGAGGKLAPMIGYGLEAMSMGFMVDEGTPIIWRGPMVTQALEQMLRAVAWGSSRGDLDVLVIDMPPGTGDVQLSMAQQAPLAGAIIVSTPQDLALIDARKGLNMFRKVDVPVLGIIENMSYFLCPKCGERSDIFGHGGARAEADKLELPFLGEVPLHMDIRATSDAGTPIVAVDPNSPHAGIFRDIAARAWQQIGASSGIARPPELTVSPAGDSLKVAFAAGETFALSAEMLRVMSPSAEVQGHSPSQRVTVGGKRNVKIKSLEPVGNYAVRIIFDDGHSTGLYSWSYLGELGREKDPRWAFYLAELEEKGLTRG